MVSSRSTSIATDRAPSFSLPLPYFLAAIAFYLGVGVALALGGPELLKATWSPFALSLVHALTLGVILMTVMGAAYQLIPVVMLATIWSERLGKAAFWLYLTGLLAMLWGFGRFDFGWLALGATALVLAVLAFLYNAMRSLLKGATWSMTGAYLVAALGCLVLAAGWGFVRVLGYWKPEWAIPMPNARMIHAHLATYGFASLLIFGISYRLFSMFAVTHGHERLERVVLPVTAIGLSGLVAGALLDSAWLVRAGAMLAAMGAWLWAVDVGRMIRGRTRKQLDAGLTYAASAVGYLLLASLMGLALAWGVVPEALSERWEVAYALLGLIGWISFSIVGQLQKIVPFLSWYHRYSALVGKKKVPLIKDLFDDKLAWWGFGSSHLGLLMLVGSVLAGQGMGIRLGGGLLACGAGALALIMYQSLTR